MSRKELVKFYNLTIKIPLNYLIQIIYQNNLVKKEGNKNKKQVQSYNWVNSMQLIKTDNNMINILELLPFQDHHNDNFNIQQEIKIKISKALWWM